MSFFDEFFGRQQIKANASGTPVETSQIKVGAGQLGYLWVQNAAKAASIWVYVFDSASASSGNIIAVIPLGTNAAITANAGFLIPMTPINFLLGCKIASSSAATFAATTTNDLNFSARFI